MKQILKSEFEKMHKNGSLQLRDVFHNRPLDYIETTTNEFYKKDKSTLLRYMKPVSNVDTASIARLGITRTVHMMQFPEGKFIFLHTVIDNSQCDSTSRENTETQTIVYFKKEEPKEEKTMEKTNQPKHTLKQLGQKNLVIQYTPENLEKFTLILENHGCVPPVPALYPNWIPNKAKFDLKSYQCFTLMEHYITENALLIWSAIDLCNLIEYAIVHYQWKGDIENHPEYDTIARYCRTLNKIGHTYDPSLLHKFVQECINA